MFRQIHHFIQKQTGDYTYYKNPRKIGEWLFSLVLFVAIVLLLTYGLQIEVI